MINVYIVLIVCFFVLIPFIPTRKAYRPMHANHFTTFRTKPFRFFVPDEMSDAKFIYHFEIVDHAHSILCSVALVQIFQSEAGKTITTIATIFDVAFGDMLAISNFASSSIF